MPSSGLIWFHNYIEYSDPPGRGKHSKFGERVGGFFLIPLYIFSCLKESLLTKLIQNPVKMEI